MTRSTHYSKGQNMVQLYKWAKETAPLISRAVKLIDGKAVPVFIYAGMSGTSEAVPLAMEYAKRGRTYGMIYVRKDGEKSHGGGRPCEFNLSGVDLSRPILPIFVDDLVDSGTTRERVYSKAITQLKDIGYETIHPYLVEALAGDMNWYGSLTRISKASTYDWGSGPIWLFEKDKDLTSRLTES